MVVLKCDCTYLVEEDLTVEKFNIKQVAVGRRDVVTVYGSDYDTVDGTGVRDYIHISDLSLGHVKAVDMLTSPKFKGWKAYNLGKMNYSYLLRHIYKVYCVENF